MAQGRGGASAGRAIGAMAFAVACCCCVVIADAGTTYYVGDSNGWSFSSPSWPNGKHFRAGDTLGTSRAKPAFCNACSAQVRSAAFGRLLGTENGHALCVCVCGCSVQVHPLDPQRGGRGRGRVQRLHDAAGVADLHVRRRQHHARQGGQLLHLHPVRPLQPRHEARRLCRVSTAAAAAAAMIC